MALSYMCVDGGHMLSLFRMWCDDRHALEDFENQPKVTSFLHGIIVILCHVDVEIFHVKKKMKLSARMPALTH